MMNGEQMDALKRQVDRTAADLEAARAEVTQLKKDIVAKEERYALHYLMQFTKDACALKTTVSLNALNFIMHGNGSG